MKTFGKFIAELSVRDAAGKKIVIRKEPVRMASGNIKMMHPAKSSSSKGGE